MTVCKVCRSDLRHRVDVLKRGSSTPQPGTATVANVYTLRYRVWAAVRTRKPGPREIEQVAVAPGERFTHEIIIRYRSDGPDIRDRVRDDKDNLYEIHSVENLDEEDEWLRLLCIRSGVETQDAAR